VQTSLVGAQTIGGMVTRMAVCEKHRRDYVQMFIPGANVWAGQCEECSAEEKLSARVDELLAERRAEKWKRVDSIMQKRAPEIEAAIDHEMEAEREERRAEWRGHIEGPMRKGAELQVESEMRVEIISSLKSQAVPQVAAGR
jgi:hypothetical protein